MRQLYNCQNKNLYYNLQEMKTSASASKRNDRRWEAVGSHVDGSVKGAAGVLRLGDSWDDILCIAGWKELIDVASDERGRCYTNVWEEFGIGNNSGWTETAWNAVDLFVQSWRNAKSAREQAERWKEYGSLRVEQEKELK
jgi:hypothetical protein